MLLRKDFRLRSGNSTHPLFLFTMPELPQDHTVSVATHSLTCTLFPLLPSNLWTKSPSWWIINSLVWTQACPFCDVFHFVRGKLTNQITQLSKRNYVSQSPIKECKRKFNLGYLRYKWVLYIGTNHTAMQMGNEKPLGVTTEGQPPSLSPKGQRKAEGPRI